LTDSANLTQAQSIVDILLSKQAINAEVANLIKTESYNNGKKQDEVIL